MIKQFLLAAALAASVTTTHTTGTLATKGTNGAWATVTAEMADSAVNVVNVSASANGKNTYLDCEFIDPYHQTLLKENHVLLCATVVRGLALPSRLTIKLTNENNGPVAYDVAVETTK